MVAACVAIDKYYERHQHECLPADIAAYKNYGDMRWIEAYGKRGFQLYYAHRLFTRRSVIAHEAFDIYLDDVEVGTAVVSIGCGPGPELAAAYELLERRVKNVRFLGIDSEKGWERLFRAWTKRVARRKDQFYWRTEKITNEKKLIKLLKAEKASVVIFSHFLLDFGGDLNPRRLIEQVPTLQQVIIFDHPCIKRIVKDDSSSMEIIYRDDYLIHRKRDWARKDSWVEKVQVLAYSRFEMITTPGFAILLRCNRSPRIYELCLEAGHFKSVERSTTERYRYGYRKLVPFTAINFLTDETNFRNNFVDLVAPYLANASNISVSAFAFLRIG